MAVMFVSGSYLGANLADKDTILRIRSYLLPPLTILDIWPRVLDGTTEISGMSGYVDPALLDGSSAYNSWNNPTAHVPPVLNHGPTVPKDMDEDMGDLFGDAPAAPARSATVFRVLKAVNIC